MRHKRVPDGTWNIQANRVTAVYRFRKHIGADENVEKWWTPDLMQQMKDFGIRGLCCDKYKGSWKGMLMATLTPDDWQAVWNARPVAMTAEQRKRKQREYMRDRMCCVGCKKVMGTYVLQRAPLEFYCKTCRTDEMVQYKRRNMTDGEVNEQKAKHSRYMHDRRSAMRVNQDLEGMIKLAFYHTRGAHGQEPDFDLTWEEIIVRVSSRDERWSSHCAITGLPFDTTKPWMCPSIDADHPEAGHTFANCQLVLQIINYAKNSLTTAEFRSLLQRVGREDGDGDGVDPTFEMMSYRRPNKEKARQPYRLVNPDLPLDMTPRSRITWDALVCSQGAEGAATASQLVDMVAPRVGDDKWCRRNVLYSLEMFIKAGYVEKISGESGTQYRPVFPLRHSDVHCGSCGAIIRLECLLVRDSRSEKACLLASPTDTNQAYRKCRSCRTKMTLKSRQRDRETYIWSKIKGRMKDRKDGDLTIDDMPALCVDRCPVLGLPLTYTSDCAALQASPDRINSKVGYTRTNTRVVSLIVNYARKDFDNEILSDGEVKRILLEAAYNNAC